MLKDGMYVRMKIAPNTRMGTISKGRVEAGKMRYLFHHDPRFLDTTPDAEVFDDEVEECSRPSDAQVKLVNEMVQKGI